MLHGAVQSDAVSDNLLRADVVIALDTLGCPPEVAEALAQIVGEAPCTRFVPGWWDLPAGVREQVHVWLRQQGRHGVVEEGRAGWIWWCVGCRDRAGT